MSADANYSVVMPPPVTANITDNDTAGVQITPTTVNVTEDGATDSYTVVLASRPQSTVTIQIASTPSGQVTLDNTTLSFTPGNWDLAQTVQVTAVDDLVAEPSPHQAQITHAVSSSAPGYSTLGNGPTVTANIEDNDSASVSVVPTSIDVTEGAAGADYEVVLTSKPTSTVTITISAPAGVQVSRSQFIFSTGNWATPQTATVTAPDDNVAQGSRVRTIDHLAAVSTDPNYSGQDVPDVTVNITDDDAAGVSITPTTVDVTEGGTTGTYQVRLQSQPTLDVVVTIDPGAEVTTNKTELTFTPSNWSTNQSVTVTAVDDDVAEGLHTETIAHAVTTSDATYSAVVPSAVTVNITDND
jgi:hypothetical protein